MIFILILVIFFIFMLIYINHTEYFNKCEEKNTCTYVNEYPLNKKPSFQLDFVFDTFKT